MDKDPRCQGSKVWKLWSCLLQSMESVLPQTLRTPPFQNLSTAVLQDLRTAFHWVLITLFPHCSMAVCLQNLITAVLQGLRTWGLTMLFWVVHIVCLQDPYSPGNAVEEIWPVSMLWSRRAQGDSQKTSVEIQSAVLPIRFARKDVHSIGLEVWTLPFSLNWLSANLAILLFFIYIWYFEELTGSLKRNLSVDQFVFQSWCPSLPSTEALPVEPMKNPLESKNDI